MEPRETTLPDTNRWWRFVLSPRFSHRFPWLVLVAGLVIRVSDPPAYHTLVESEFGFIENATVALLAVMVIATIVAFRKRQFVPARWFGPFAIMLLLGAIYFGGEESSWGQHWFGWETPESLAALNAQDETNLHNTSSWFNEKPRIILELSILTGLIWAVARDRRRRGAADPTDDLYWLLPGKECYSVALATVLVQYPERLGKLLPELTGASAWNFRLAEYQEFFFAVYLLTYMCSILRRIDQQEQKKKQQREESDQHVLPFASATDAQQIRLVA
ncbi:MAG: hypothetical protein Fues2KO_35190 [Fuerstiella sp.]